MFTKVLLAFLVMIAAASGLVAPAPKMASRVARSAIRMDGKGE